MIVVIIASSSIELDIREQNSETKNLLRFPGRSRATKNRKVKFRSFNPVERLRKIVLINTKTIATVNFREMKNTKTANPPFCC